MSRFTALSRHPARDDLFFRHIFLDDCASIPWKNGGGSTREILAEPAGAAMDDFRWRLSCADVATEGPFSTFEGIERIITLIRGDAMVLHNDDTDTRHSLLPAVPYPFSGNDRIRATLPAGPTQDLNLMWNPLTVTATAKVIGNATELATGQGDMLLHCIHGHFEVCPGLQQDHDNVEPDFADQAWSLQPGDTLHIQSTASTACKLQVKPVHNASHLFVAWLSPNNP